MCHQDIRHVCICYIRKYEKLLKGNVKMITIIKCLSHLDKHFMSRMDFFNSIILVSLIPLFPGSDDRVCGLVFIILNPCFTFYIHSYFVWFQISYIII